ncbi:MAG: FMN-binding protein [Patescibacteria group bacterium]|jgi:major membrane immunogen (membrane-anchored lipoprotein)
MQHTAIEKYLGSVGAVMMAGLVLLGAGCSNNAPVAVQPAQPNVVVTEPVSVPIKSDPSTAPIAVKYSYKNGTYSLTQSYFTPDGSEDMGVSVTLKNDVITGATVTNKARNGTSMQYEDIFIRTFKTVVVGQKIQDLHLSRVSGASLTTRGFNSALAQIMTKASS